MVNFVTALAYHFCLALPVAFTQPGDHLLGEPCSIAPLSDTPTFPAIGNHESFPVNMFPSPSEDGKFSPSWLYSGLADLYEKWLPGEGQQATLREAGYFSVSMNVDLWNLTPMISGFFFVK